jgi:hypothetical protein
MVMRAFVAIFVLVLFSLPAFAAEEPKVKRTFSKGEKLCKSLSLSAILGKSPWLVMGVGGAYEYFTTVETERASLGFFSQPAAWITILVLVGMVMLKDTILSAFSYLKLPLDTLAELLHVSGWFAGLIYLGTSVFGTETPLAETASLSSGLFAVEPSGFTVESVLLWLVLAVIHTVVWIVFNTIEVVILLNPFPYVDTLLKSLRTGLIGLVTLATQIHPVLGLIVVLPIILGCCWFLPFAWRFLVLGWVFSIETIRGWLGHRAVVDPQRLRCFSSWNLQGVPLYTYGTIQRVNDKLEFRYRRWGLFLKTTVIDSPMAKVWSGILGPLVAVELAGVYLTLVRFPPSYRGCEPQLSDALQTGNPQDGSLNATLRMMVSKVSSLFLPGRRE